MSANTQVLEEHWSLGRPKEKSDDVRGQRRVSRRDRAVDFCASCAA